MDMDLGRVTAASARYPKPQTFHPSYGTAGFRAEASQLDSTVFRCGLLTAARSVVMGRACGLMITASHNPEPDNGVKIVEPDGGMLVVDWEMIATELARETSDSAIAAFVQRVVESNGIEGDASGGTVVLGYDTRPSGPRLLEAAKAGVQALNGRVIDLGQVTTPQLHFQVVALNQVETDTCPGQAPDAPPLEGYFTTLLDAFEQLVSSSADNPTEPYTLYVDCANGVGATQLQTAAAKLAGGSSGLRLELINTGDAPGSLNSQCGADFVQKEQVAPQGFDSLPATARCCSIDGDADRLVYFKLEGGGTSSGVNGKRKVTLLDGDRIAALAACLVKKLLSQLPEGVSQGIQVGVVQTAYANGASTHYLEQDQGLRVLCAKTGVKHLHPAAHQFDVGIYFEANGHGTVLFSPSLLADLEELSHLPAARQLIALSKAVNQTVGDALSGILLVEAALRLLGLDIQAWLDLYHDLPSRQRKLVVQDRSAVVSHDPAERRVSAPEGLQDRIDQLVAEAGPQARAFVRASGTEDAVRVYAEASSQQVADTLALRVAQAVHVLAGGVGPQPEQ